MTISSPLTKEIRISLVTSVVLLALSIPILDVRAQKGGAAEGGDATVGGPSYNCNVPGACPNTQAPRGGDATGGNAIGGHASGPDAAPPAESPPAESTSKCMEKQENPDSLQAAVECISV